MRRRLLLAIIGVSVAALVVLGVPLAYLLDRLAHQEATARLQRQAESLLLAVEFQLAAGDSVNSDDLRELVPPGDFLVLRLGGTAASIGQRPTGESLTVRTTGQTGLQLQLTTSAAPVIERVRRALVVLAAFSAVGLGAAALLAGILARRLSAPLDDLAAVAARLGDGDFSVTAPRSGLPEVDAIAEALNRSSARIAELVRAERAFSANASHQLRSSLTGLRLRLEELAAHPDPDVRAEAGAALDQATRLSDVVGELLALARTGRAGRAGRFDLAALVGQHVEDWRPALARQHRPLRVVTEGTDGPVIVTATAGAVGQALDVLLANALDHGAGTVTVRLRRDDATAAVEVEDEGAGVPAEAEGRLFERRPDAEGHGIGLALARALVEAEAGRLELVQPRPAVFRLVLPLTAEAWPPPSVHPHPSV